VPNQEQSPTEDDPILALATTAFDIDLVATAPILDLDLIARIMLENFGRLLRRLLLLALPRPGG
jgi:hypothetical protein